MAVSKKWLNDWMKSLYQPITRDFMMKEIPKNKEGFTEPVQNQELLDEISPSKWQPKEALEFKKDYLVVNPKIWFILEKIYGSDFAIMVQDHKLDVVEDPIIILEHEEVNISQ